MPRIPREITEHSLRIWANAKPVKQCLRRFDDERCGAIEDEIAKLLDAGFIREVLHPDWLANPVLIPKRTTNEECVSTIWALTRRVPRILIPCSV